MKTRRVAKHIIMLLYCMIVFGTLIFFGSKSVFAVEDHLVINEVYSCPKTGESEWIELYNPTSVDINLSTFSIEDGTHLPKTLVGYSIASNSYLVLNKSIDFTFGLNNDGDTIILKNIGLAIDQVSYGNFDDGDKTDNAKAPEQGKSIARYPNGKDSDIDSSDFIVMIPTKGSENIKPIYPHELIISELVPEPIDGAAKEFVELYNQSNSDIDLNGWSLDDSIIGSPYLLTGTIKSQEYRAFYTHSKISLNDNGDSVTVYDPNSDIVSSISYNTAEKGKSYSKDGDTWQWSSTLTPNEKNVFDENIEFNKLIITIEEARAKENGEDITVVGTVTTLPGVLSSQYFYIQDGTGGIQIYCYDKTFPQLTLGDSISVTGELSETSNDRRVKITGADKIVILNHTEPIVPMEIDISGIGEDSEGEYVKTAGIVTQTSGDTFYISDGQKEIKVVIRSSTGIDKPKMKKGDQVEVSGIVSQYKDEYRILPINQDDVKIVASESLLPRAGIGEYIYFIISLFLLFLWNIYLKVKKKPIT